MMFVMILEVSGILLFSLTSEKIRALKTNLNHEMMAKEQINAMAYYMFEIDEVLEGDIPEEIYDGAIDSMKNSVMFSTVNVFKKWPYYNN